MSLSSPALGDYDFGGRSLEGSFFSFDIRTTAALGFFPLGGNLLLQEREFNTYIFGGAADFFNLQSSKIRITFLSITPYLIGFNWTASDTSDESQFFNIGMLHLGPHFRVSALSVGKSAVALGMQPGYAFVLKSDTLRGTTRYVHGIDLAATISWTPDDLVRPSASSPVLIGIGGAFAMIGGGSIVGGTLADDLHEDLRIGLLIGGGVAFLGGIIVGVVGQVK